MSAITTTPDTDQLTLPIDVPDHYRVLGRFFWRCIQPECDGEHHWYCSCHDTR